MTDFKYYDREGLEISQEVYLHYKEDRDGDYTRVALTNITDDIHVSTVWLGSDCNYSGLGPPITFETMVFGLPDEDFNSEVQLRYSTEEEARHGHNVLVADVRYELGAGRLGWCWADEIGAWTKRRPESPDERTKTILKHSLDNPDAPSRDPWASVPSPAIKAFPVIPPLDFKYQFNLDVALESLRKTSRVTLPPARDTTVT